MTYGRHSAHRRPHHGDVVRARLALSADPGVTAASARSRGGALLSAGAHRERRHSVARALVLLLALALPIAAVACQQSEASELGPPVDPREPATVAQGAEPTEGGLLGWWLRREPIHVRVPAGTELRIRLLQPISTEASRKGQGFLAAVADDVVVDGTLAIRAGARVTGTVRDVVREIVRAHADEGAHIDLSIDAVEIPSGGAARLDGLLTRQAEHKKLILPAGTVLSFPLASATTVELALDGERR